MKRISTLLVFLLSFSVVSLQAQTDWDPGAYMQQAVDNVHEKAELATSFGDYGYSGGFCFLGAYILKSKSVKWRTNLPTGKQLLFIGGGDDDATDVDIKIYDDEDNLVAEDSDTDNNPVLKFKTSSDEYYTIELKLYSTTTTGSFCCISFLEEDAPGVPMANMKVAMASIIDYGQKVNEKFSVRFHDVDNQWCLYGVNQASGTSNTCTNMSMGTENHIYLAAGDNNLEDADLYLMDSDGDDVVKDVEDDAVPGFKYTTDVDVRYQLKIKNVKSTGNALTICIVLTE
jgi:hypothetical protein